MPGMPDLLLKPPVFDRMETLSRKAGFRSGSKLKNAISDLAGSSSAKSIVDIAMDLDLYKTPKEAEHLKLHWLNDPPGSGFWPSVDVEPILRAGLLFACKRFKLKGLPLEFFWVISGDQNTSRWEVSVSVGKKQITVMFHTPQFPCFVPTVQATSMWIARKEAGAVVTRKVLIPQP